MTDTSEFKLSLEAHKQVFEQNILNNTDIVKPIATPQKYPKAVVLAGQSGAGKGTLANEVRLDFNDNIVTIDPDVLRDKYPNVDAIKSQKPYTWSDVTHEEASSWGKELRAEMIAQRKNILIDGTNPKPAVIQQLKDAGYEVEVRVVATHRVESVLGVEQRYMGSLDREGHGRYVPPSIQEPIYNALPESLDKVRERACKLFCVNARVQISSKAALYRQIQW
ncbi:MAG: zeta toxin family protein [Formosimonas sp.]